jgi:hypothetical protein
MDNSLPVIPSLRILIARLGRGSVHGKTDRDLDMRAACFNPTTVRL